MTRRYKQVGLTTGFGDSAERMLEAAYQDLGFADGKLLVATNTPDDNISPDDWVERGEWLATAQEAGAERVFFVDGNPVVVFAKHDGDDPGDIRRMINRIWCMARPRLLFLASPGELRVFDLADKPIAPDEEGRFLRSGKRTLAHAKGIRNVQQALRAYSMEQIETGKLFEEEKRFGKPGHRADEALIRDLRALRAKLTQIPGEGLGFGYAHALIGRSIFIRYLEDRKILLREHFEEIATSHPEWLRILDMPYEKGGIEPDIERRLYPKVLRDKEFTYALFHWLANEFNGDMFPRDTSEHQAVSIQHLQLLRRFLLGDVEDQPHLFFYAYDFGIIPIELISSIYEEFYTKETGENADKGTHYTPSALVEFVVSRVLTRERLAEDPRILDPACGSGIFLVEAFRRIVRYRASCQSGKLLSADDLRHILRHQIAGIEIHPEAVRIAAFSLYLALLHYQDPSNIRAHPRLPNLVYDQSADSGDDDRYDTLLHANAFDVEPLFADQQIADRFGESTFDIVIGNPPWGFPKKRDEDMVAAGNVALQWCKERNYSVGDKELSQAFVHRTISMLRNEGVAGLLLSSGILFKTHEHTQLFRRQWLEKAALEHVVNFAHVRRVFFSRGMAPFISVVFRKGRTSRLGPFEYWSAKYTALTAMLRTPIMSRVDLRLLQQDAVSQWDTLWKIHWFGGHLDEALIRKLRMEQHLGQIRLSGSEFVIDIGRGYQDRPGGDQRPSGQLRDYPELRTEDLKRYGPLDRSKGNRVRDTVHRLGKVDENAQPTLYDGLRLLFRRGIPGRGQDKGQIIATLSSEPFCFRHSIHAVRLDERFVDEGKMLLGICWSSLVRYYLFLTVGSWGPWHDELQLEEHITKLPIRLPEAQTLRLKLIRIVDELLHIDPLEGTLSGRIAELESELDDAVFEVYEFTEAERDLVLDMCRTGLDLFYNKARSSAVRLVPTDIGDNQYGVFDDLPTHRAKSSGIAGYLYAFLRVWNRELEPDGEFRWQVICPTPNSPMIGVVFSTQYKENPLPPPEETDSKEWKQILRDLGRDSTQPYGSRRVFTDGLVRSISPTDIMIIKRNEQRLWTRSMAREDAEAVLLQAMLRQQVVEDAPHGSA